VRSRVAKPLFGLIVLLAWPWLGLGGSARACFVLGPLAAPPERESSSAGLALDGTLDSGARYDATADAERQSPKGSSWWANLSPAWHGLQTGAATGGMSPFESAPGAGGPGLVGILAPDFPPDGGEKAERLFLGDERFKPPPFASRLFRPPRRA